MEKIKKFEHEIVFALVLGLVISSLVAFWGDVQETLEEIVSFHWWLAPVIVSLTCFNYFLRFFRWHFFLRKIGFRQELSWQKSGLIFLAGLPLTLTPGKTGEVLKAYFLKKITGDHLSRTVPVVITERLTDGLAALVLLSLSFSLYPFGWWAAGFALFSCGLFIFLIYHPGFWRFCFSCLKKGEKKRKIFFRIRKKLFLFRDVLLELIDKKSLLVATSLAAVAWLAEAVGFALIISSIAEQPLTFTLISRAIFIFCFVSILGFVSFLPGGLGVAEGGFVGMLVLLLSLSSSQAAAATILLRLFTLWWGVGLGLGGFFIVLRSLKDD